jgi:hypothetical protein
MGQLTDNYYGSESDILQRSKNQLIRTNKEKDNKEKEKEEEEEESEFETQTGKDPEAEALSGEHVDVEKTGKTHNESKSYRNRFRTKL